MTNQTSIVRFMEDNWGLGGIGNQSFDAKAGSLMSMFDFTTAEFIHLSSLLPNSPAISVITWLSIHNMGLVGHATGRRYFINKLTHHFLYRVW